MKIKDRWMQILIALDQLLNTLVWYGDSYSDETLSARAFRMTDISCVWNTTHKIIDYIFLRVFNDYNHCYNSYLSEIRRTQLPKEYTASRLHAAFFYEINKKDKNAELRNTY